MNETTSEKNVEGLNKDTELQAVEQDLDLEITLNVAESSFSYSEPRVF